MLHYDNIGTMAVKVELPKDGFFVLVMGMPDKGTGNYKTTWYLGNPDMDMLDLMEDFAEVAVEGDMKNIRANVLREVSNRFYEHKMDVYLARYEFIEKCIDIGCDVLEGRG